MNGATISLAQGDALRNAAAGPFADPSAERTLVDVLDRLLDRGVILTGDLKISVADVDLLFVGLKLVLASVDTMEDARQAQIEAMRASFDWRRTEMGAVR